MGLSLTWSLMRFNGSDNSARLLKGSQRSTVVEVTTGKLVCAQRAHKKT